MTDRVETALLQWETTYNGEPLPFGVLGSIECDSDPKLMPLITGGYAQEIGKQVPTRSVNIVIRREENKSWTKYEQIKTPAPHYGITQKGFEKLKEIKGVMYDMVMEWYLMFGERTITQNQLLGMFPLNFSDPRNKGTKICHLSFIKLIDTKNGYTLTPKGLEFIKQLHQPIKELSYE